MYEKWKNLFTSERKPAETSAKVLEERRKKIVAEQQEKIAPEEAPAPEKSTEEIRTQAEKEKIENIRTKIQPEFLNFLSRVMTDFETEILKGKQPCSAVVLCTIGMFSSANIHRTERIDISLVQIQEALDAIPEYRYFIKFCIEQSYSAALVSRKVLEYTTNTSQPGAFGERRSSSHSGRFEAIFSVRGYSEKGV